jgi:hypothetical protein
MSAHFLGMKNNNMKKVRKRIPSLTGTRYYRELTEKVAFSEEVC